MSTLFTATPRRCRRCRPRSPCRPPAPRSRCSRRFERRPCPVAVIVAPSASETSERVVTMLIRTRPATVTVLPPLLFVSDVGAFALSVSVFVGGLARVGRARVVRAPELVVGLAVDVLVRSSRRVVVLALRAGRAAEGLGRVRRRAGGAQADVAAAAPTAERVIVAETWSSTIASASARPITTVPGDGVGLRGGRRLRRLRRRQRDLAGRGQRLGRVAADAMALRRDRWRA